MRPTTTTVTVLLTAAKYLFFIAAVAALLTIAVTSYRSGASSESIDAWDAAGVTADGTLGVLCDDSRWSALPPAKQLDIARTLYKDIVRDLSPEYRQRMPISTDSTTWGKKPVAFYDVAADAIIPAVAMDVDSSTPRE
jgi:hypothetical protein